MIVGYVRVSTRDQNEARQFEALKPYNCERIYHEKISGKNTERPELQAMLNFVREGDTVVCESFSRLARSTVDLLTITSGFEKKGIKFISTKENIDTSTPTGRLMLTFLAAIAQFERELILERQGEGIVLRKEEDRQRKEQGLEPLTYKGRKRLQYDPERFKIEVELVEQGKQTHETAAKNLGFIDQDGKLKMRTYFRRVKELKEQKEPETESLIPENLNDAIWDTDKEVWSYLAKNPNYTRTLEKELTTISELTKEMVEEEKNKEMTLISELRKELNLSDEEQPPVDALAERMNASEKRFLRNQKLDKLARKVRKQMEKA